jgi:cobalt-zinc-cadmium efflux system outer membrane protein
MRSIVRSTGVLLLAARVGWAQQPLSRAEAWSAALAHSPRLGMARADSAFARGTLLGARQFENPTVGLSYSRSTPQEHYAVDLPLDYPWLRRDRIGSAAAGFTAARYRLQLERAAAGFEVDAGYTEALAAARRARLSAQTARDADSVLTLARFRRDAGDGTELDVQLAIVNAGQLTNDAQRDQLDALSALLALQGAIGMAADSVRIALTDTLEAGVLGDAPAGTLLAVGAAEEDVKSAERSLALAKGLVWPAPSLSLGFESRDPGGTENQALPTIGFSFPLPLLNRNAGAVAQAQAVRDRVVAALTFARIGAVQQAAKARREATAARARLDRSAQLLGAAERVAALALVAFREGAAGLPSVLEAQRSARTAMTQYVTDLAAARTAAALLRFATLTVNDTIP